MLQSVMLWQKLNRLLSIERIEVALRQRANWFISRLMGMTPTEMVESRAVRDVAGSLFLRVASTLLQIGLAILVARMLPLESFGLYALVMSWVLVLVVPSMVGTTQFVQREIAVARSRAQWERVKGLFRWSTYTVSAISFLVFVAASGWIFIRMPSGNSDRYAFWVGFISIPGLALMQLWQAQLRGWGSVLAGQIPTAIIRPLMFCVLLLVMGVMFANLEMTASLVLAVHLTAVLLALGMTVFLKLRHVHIPRGTRSVAEPWNWFRLSFRFTLLGGLVIINSRIGILMVGDMLGKADTGLLMVAVKGSDLLLVGLMAANIALSPRMASFYHAGDIKKLQQMITRTYRIVALITIPVVLLFVFFGDFFLSIFGQAYVAAWPALIILSFAQLISVLGGPVGGMLNMAGQERLTMMGIAVSVFVNVIANAVLIPVMGINGAALATTLSILTATLLLTFLCYKRLGIWTPVLGGRVSTASRRSG